MFNLKKLFILAGVLMMASCSSGSNSGTKPENLEAFAIIACGYPESVRPQQNRFDKDRIHYVL